MKLWAHAAVIYYEWCDQLVRLDMCSSPQLRAEALRQPLDPVYSTTLVYHHRYSQIIIITQITIIT